MPVRGSRGGQVQNNAEARRRLKAIGSVDWMSAVPDSDQCFISDMFYKADHQLKGGMGVTGQQMERLRQVYSGLVERGLLPVLPVLEPEATA